MGVSALQETADASITARWSSHRAYVLAATGAAVGLGNIWKFPYIMGENGGGAFVLVYLLCILVIGIPIMIAEVSIGKYARTSPSSAMAALAKASKSSHYWRYIGWIAVLASYLILTFYLVVAGWAVTFTGYALVDQFHNSAIPVHQLYDRLVSDPSELYLYTMAVLVASILIVGLGVSKGLERTVSVLMPTLFLMLIFLAVYSLFNGDANSALTFMFESDFNKLSINSVLVALGHAFFSLSLASGIMLVYGAYLPDSTSIVKSSVMIAIADTMVALLAGMAIYPIVFANGLSPSEGPGLIFKSLPIAFSSMTGGYLFSVLFFVMIVCAAFTSAIALLESGVAWLMEQFRISRWSAVALAGSGLAVLCVGTCYSFVPDSWAHFSFSFREQKISFSYFTMMDYLTANILMPIGGALTSIFFGWFVSRQIKQQVIATTPTLFAMLSISLKVIAPVAITLVFLQLVGIIHL